jgi:acyl carrier protein
MSNVASDVQELLQEHFSLVLDQVAPEQKLEDLGIDSLSAIEFMFQLEDTFQISLSEERGEMRTVSDVVAIVERALAVKEATV